MDIDPVKSQVSPAEKSLEIHIGDVDIIDVDVDVDDQAKTRTLGALTASAAADALASLSPKQKKDANGTQEIEIGDVLEVMQKPAQKAPASTRSVPRPGMASAKVAPPSDQAVHGIVVPAPPSAPQMVLPSVMVRSTPVPPDATQELVAADVLEEVVVQKVGAQVAPAPITAPLLDAGQAYPLAPTSNSDIAKTHVLPQTARQPLAQFPMPAHQGEKPLARFSLDEEVAPFASDTVDIPLNRVAGMPLWLQVKDKPQLIVVGGAVAACLAIGALALGIHLHTASADSSAQTANANAATGPAMHKEDPAAAIPPPPSQPDVQTVSIDDLKRAPAHGAPPPPATPEVASHPWQGASAPSHASHASHHVSHHTESASASAPAPKAHASKPEGFGLVRTWIAARGEPISVDGKSVGVAPSPVRVACGPHTIAIGHEIVKADIPCDGAITVGSPDHKKQ